jgi:hypothetical protein
MRTLLAIFLFSLACSCAKNEAPPEVEPPPRPKPLLVTLRGAAPQLPGSLFAIEGYVPPGEGAVVLAFEEASTGASFELSPEGAATLFRMTFVVPSAMIERFGEGSHILRATLKKGADSSESIVFPFDFARSVEVRVFGVPNASNLHRNDRVELLGDGFVTRSEGAVSAALSGTFTVAGTSETRAVSVTLPVIVDGADDRQRAHFVLSTEVGGLEPGRFVGSMLVSSDVGGTVSTSQTVELDFVVKPPEVVGIRDGKLFVGGYALVEGSGFLLDDVARGENTRIYLVGSFTPEPRGPDDPSGAPIAIDTELVGEVLSGGLFRATVDGVESDVELPDTRMLASLFGARRGRFVGTLTARTQAGAAVVESAPKSVVFDLAPKQVVVFNFLGNFYDTLSKFGLDAATGTIEELVRQRFQSIYADYNVEARLGQPDDFPASAITTIDISGPDPNGIGLFGFDATPTKDQGNLRIYDLVGGSNWMEVENGYPGYGGVFIESFLAFSPTPAVRPDIPPQSGPTPEPLFDEIFLPTVLSPATFEEVLDRSPDQERDDVVFVAVRSLANMIGETTAHEFAHSLGLANPDVPGAPHNFGDEDGCLMEQGVYRPLGERMALPGFPETRHCEEAPQYLDDILGP